MEEQESIMYVILSAVVLFIMPGVIGKQGSLYAVSFVLILGAIILLASAISLIAIKNIPFLSPYIPVTLGDKTIKLLSWIGVLVVGILLIIINLLDALAA
ncbi:MAG: hypothetical protein KAT16_10740 [Candidatus Heimdallarchaeota archaeon]|nr:hypothetical protein [Candidatus Heimdallarchaeota archaeon]